MYEPRKNRINKKRQNHKKFIIFGSALSLTFWNGAQLFQNTEARYVEKVNISGGTIRTAFVFPGTMQILQESATSIGKNTANVLQNGTQKYKSFQTAQAGEQILQDVKKQYEIIQTQFKQLELIHKEAQGYQTRAYSDVKNAEFLLRGIQNIKSVHTVKPDRQSQQIVEEMREDIGQKYPGQDEAKRLTFIHNLIRAHLDGTLSANDVLYYLQDQHKKSSEQEENQRMLLTFAPELENNLRSVNRIHSYVRPSNEAVNEQYQNTIVYMQKIELLIQDIERKIKELKNQEKQSKDEQPKAKDKDGNTAQPLHSKTNPNISRQTEQEKPKENTSTETFAPQPTTTQTAENEQPNVSLENNAIEAQEPAANVTVPVE